MVRRRTSVTAWLAALAMTAAGAASAQPIDLLGPATVTAPPDNTTPSDAHPATTPSLPGPPLLSGEPPVAFLEAARQALQTGRIGEAQEALERAETRLLSIAVAPGQASSSEHAVLAIRAARSALATHDRQGAIRAIDDASAAVILAAQPTTPSSPPVGPIQSVPVQPIVTYALLPGHWQLQGAQYVWVPPETVLRPVAYWRYVQGRSVWRDGEWVWVPARYE